MKFLFTSLHIRHWKNNQNKYIIRESFWQKDQNIHIYSNRSQWDVTTPWIGHKRFRQPCLWQRWVGNMSRQWWWHMKHIEENFHSIQEALHTCFFPHVTSQIQLANIITKALLWPQHHLLANWCFLIWCINLRVDVNTRFCYYFVSCYMLYILGVNICLFNVEC